MARYWVFEHFELLGPKEPLELLSMPGFTPQTLLNTEPSIRNCRPVSAFPELEALYQLNRMQKTYREQLSATQEAFDDLEKRLREQGARLAAKEGEREQAAARVEALARQSVRLEAELKEEKAYWADHFPKRLREGEEELQRTKQRLAEADALHAAANDALINLQARLDASEEARGLQAVKEKGLAQALEAQAEKWRERLSGLEAANAELKAELRLRAEALERSVKDELVLEESLRAQLSDAKLQAREARASLEKAREGEGRAESRRRAAEEEGRRRAEELAARLVEAQNEAQDARQEAEAARAQLRRSVPAARVEDVEEELKESLSALKKAEGRSAAAEAEVLDLKAAADILRKNARIAAGELEAARAQLRSSVPAARLTEIEQALARRELDLDEARAALKKAESRAARLAAELADLKETTEGLKEASTQASTRLEPELQDARSALKEAENRAARLEAQLKEARFAALPAEPRAPSMIQFPPTKADDSRPKADLVYAAAIDSMRGALKRAETFSSQEAPADIRSACASLQDACADPALLALCAYTTRESYIPSHCVNTAILSLRLGMEFGWTKERHFLLGLGALLHEIGFAKKLGFTQRMTDANWQADLEKLANPMTLPGQAAQPRRIEEILDAQPGGFSPEELRLAAGLIARCDLFEAMSHPRPWRASMHAHEALKVIIRGKGTDEDRAFSRVLVAGLSLYPPGSLVRLSTGEIAFVTGVRTGLPTRPDVEIEMEADGSRRAPALALFLAENPRVRVINALGGAKLSAAEHALIDETRERQYWAE